MTADYPEYRVYASRAAFRGSDVFEFYPGRFEGCISWWNEGSVYVREEGLKPFERTITDIVPNFDPYGETRLTGPQIDRLARRFDRLAALFHTAGTRAALMAVSPLIDAEEHNVLRRRTQLIRMAGDLAAICAIARNKKTPLWILGL